MPRAEVAQAMTRRDEPFCSSAFLVVCFPGELCQVSVRLISLRVVYPPHVSGGERGRTVATVQAS